MTLDDLLYGAAMGSGDGAGGEAADGLGSRIRGQRGAAAVHALSTHVRNHLKKWNDAFDLAIWRALGCDVSGAPWSLQQYGERNIPWTAGRRVSSS